MEIINQIINMIANIMVIPLLICVCALMYFVIDDAIYHKNRRSK